RVVADAQVAADELASVVLELVTVDAVDDVDAEVVAPVVAPFLAVKTLDDEHDRADVVRDRFQPGVVLGRELGGVRREELDDGAERAFGRKERARRSARVAGAMRLVDLARVALAEDLVDER